MVEASRNDWEHKLTVALWAYQTVYKVATNSTPFSLTFGLEEVMHVEFLVPSLRIAVREQLLGNALPEHLVLGHQLNMWYVTTLVLNLGYGGKRSI